MTNIVWLKGWANHEGWGKMEAKQRVMAYIVMACVVMAHGDRGQTKRSPQSDSPKTSSEMHRAVAAVIDRTAVAQASRDENLFHNGHRKRVCRLVSYGPT